MTILLDCVADDFTGPTDLANMLTRGGMRTLQTIGVPDGAIALPEADAVVVALKSRTIPAADAVAQSVAALDWLAAQGCRQVLFKYCSTFVYLFNGARYLLASVVVLLFALQTSRGNKPVSLPAPHQYRWMLIAGLFLFMGSALQQAGLVYTTAGNAGFITSLYVVLVPIMLFLFWGERFRWLAVLAVGMAGVGAFLLSTGGSFQVQKGDALELAGALFWTFHVIILGKYASTFEAVSFSVGQLFVCGLLSLGIGLLREPAIAFTPALWFALAEAGLPERARAALATERAR